MANNQGKFDANVGVMNLCVCDGCVTLPADVSSVIAVNNDGQPTLLRDQWFQYHVDGPGIQKYVPWGYTDSLGQVSTYRDLPGPAKLAAVVENALDSNATLRVFGWDESGTRIYTTGPDGVLYDGFLVPCIYGFPGANPEVPEISIIDRIQKSVTNGSIKLIAVDSVTLESLTTIGHYLPWETVPTYQRIKVPDRSWLRIKYRKKDIEVKGEEDWINIDNREALILLIKAVKFRMDNQIETARTYEGEGMRLLSNEAEALRPPAITPPQIIFDGLPVGEWDTLIY